MKKTWTIIALLFLLLACWQADAGNVTQALQTVLARKNAGGGAPPACETADWSCPDNNDGTENTQYYFWRAGVFGNSGTGGICRVDVNILKTATDPEGNVRVCIYTDDGGTYPDNRPGSEIACSDWVLPAAVGTTASMVQFSNISTGALSDGALYWMVLQTDDTNQNTNYYSIAYETTACSSPQENTIGSTNLGSSWASQNQYRNYSFVTYK
jgi:hypothetical protein